MYNGELIVDLFAGGGGASTGIELALGVSPDVAVNHDPRAIALHEANHPETKHFIEDVFDVDPREVCGDEKVGLLWMSPDCFVSGTMVLTKKGYVDISLIKIGDEVLTHKMRWRKVIETSSSVKAIQTIAGKGHSGLSCSSEHPFLTRKKRDGYPVVLEEEEWTVANLLEEKTHYWGTPTKVEKLEIPEVGGRGMIIDKKLLWLAGRYVGDGWSRLNKGSNSRGELVIICSKLEISSLLKKADVWNRKGNKAVFNELSWSTRELESTFQISTSHSGLVEWLRDNFGHGAEHKKIPAWLYSDSILSKSFLDGYFSADGCLTEVSGGNLQNEVSTVSRALAYGLKTLLATMDMPTNVYLHENSSVIQGRNVNSKMIYKIRWREGALRSVSQVHTIDNIQWSAIKKISKDSGEEEVFNIGVDEDESYVVEGIIVHNCKHFSKAKGAKPVSCDIRSLAWIGVKWAKEVQPRVLILENVEEFKTWGPLDENDMPIPERKGETFREFVSVLDQLGYHVEWNELRASDYGAPTIRKRLFLIARNDGAPIEWPEATHGDPKKFPEREAWKTAADCIDWDIPTHSIFLTKEEGKEVGVRRPLVENTMKRLARGLRKFVIENPKPYVVGNILPFVSTFYGGGPGSNNPRGNFADAPVGTITAGGSRHALVFPYITEHANVSSQRNFKISEPLRTITAQTKGGTFALVNAFIAQHNLGAVGHKADKPLSTITQTGSQQQIVVTSSVGNHTDEMRAYMMKYYGTGEGQKIDDPAHTITTKEHSALVEVFGKQYEVVDIAMRMFTPRELYRAQGFPEDYKINIMFNNKPLPKTAQVRMCGNSVVPLLAKTLVEANYA